MTIRKKLHKFGLMAMPILGSVVCTPVFAIDYGASMLYRYEASDNIDRVTDTASPEDGTRHSVVGSLSASTRARLLDMDLDLTLTVSEDDGINGETSTDARGGLYALYNIRPGQVSWLLADYIVQQGDDLEALSNEDERFRANYFVTGPATRWRVTPVDSINLDLFYMLADEEGETEQTRQLAFQSEWSHRFSRQHAMGIHFENSDIDFKESDDEFGIVNTFGRYSYTQGKTRFNIDAGQSSSSDESTDATGVTTKTTTDEDLFRIGLSRQMSRELSLNFNGSQVFTDETMSTIRDLQSNLNSGLNTGIGPFYEKRVALGLVRGGNIWNAGLNLSNTAIEFVDTDSQVDDRETQRLSLELGYSLSSVWGLRASASQADIEYDNVNRNDDELSYGVGVSYQFAVAWGISLDADFSSIDSNRPNEVTSTQENVLVEENSTALSIYWQPQTKLSRLREKYERKQIENVLQ